MWAKVTQYCLIAYLTKVCYKSPKDSEIKIIDRTVDKSPGSKNIKKLQKILQILLKKFCEFNPGKGQ
jgi:hypothetical protein